MKIIALGDHCLIKKVASSDREVGGVLIPGSQQSLLSKGEVLSVGGGKKVSVLNLQTGDIIYYNEIENNSVATDGTEDATYFVRYDFIYGKEANN